MYSCTKLHFAWKGQVYITGTELFWWKIRLSGKRTPTLSKAHYLQLKHSQSSQNLLKDNLDRQKHIPRLTELPTRLIKDQHDRDIDPCSKTDRDRDFLHRTFSSQWLPVAMYCIYSKFWSLINQQYALADCYITQKKDCTWGRNVHFRLSVWLSLVTSL